MSARGEFSISETVGQYETGQYAPGTTAFVNLARRMAPLKCRQEAGQLFPSPTELRASRISLAACVGLAELPVWITEHANERIMLTGRGRTC